MRKDLDTVRVLVDLIRKRERERLRLTKANFDIFERIFCPHLPLIKYVLKKAKE